ncbi:MAG: hypothetical protein AAF633_00285 [Chloroflexota bacterium]
MDKPYTLKAVEDEIIRLHIFFEDWFNGTIDYNDESFAQFSGSMGPSFTMVSPGGVLISRDQITQSLYGAYRQRLGIRISIYRAKILYQSDSHILAAYEEWQTYQGERKGRLSSVLFSKEKARLVWLHVHETWLPTN